MSKLAIIIKSIREFGERTTMHGLRHSFATRDRVRQTFWFLLFTASLILGSMHLAINVKKYTERTVRSQLKLMSEEAKFPDVTICNLKPASSALSTHTKFYSYKKTHWEVFELLLGVHRNNVSRMLNDTDLLPIDEILMRIKQFYDVLWASADMTDLSHLDETMLLQCSYNGVPCHKNNFSLLQTNRFWNCYTFHADDWHRSASGVGGWGAELDLVLYTDGFWQHPAYKDTENLDLGINRANQGDNADLTGLRLIFHQPESYPFSRGEIVDVAAGSSSKIRLRPIRNNLISTSQRRCSEQPLETVRYVISFSNGSQDILTKEFTKSAADYVFEAKQRVIQQSCGCLSHRYPIPSNTAQLCYFVPYEFWRSPPDSVLAKIRCHDEWFSRVEKLSSQLAKEFRHRRWCEYYKQRPSHLSSSWPPFESVAEIWDQLIFPQIKDGIEFLPTDGKKHHIFDEMAVSRQTIMFSNLVLSDEACYDYFCGSNTHRTNSCDTNPDLLERASICVPQESLAKNVAAIRITLEGSAADAYVEEMGFEWTEALSEVGGTLGLWLGVSIVSILELLELVYILLRAFTCGRPTAGQSRILEGVTDHQIQATSTSVSPPNGRDSDRPRSRRCNVMRQTVP